MLRGLLRHYRQERRTLVALASFGLLTAFAEAASLVALAPLLQAVAEGRDEYQGDVGPFQLRLSLGELTGIAAVLISATLVLTLAASYVSARIVSSFQLRRRLDLVDSFLGAEWEEQASSRDGRLVAYSLEFVNQSAGGLRDLASLARYSAGLIVFVVGALLVSWRATAAIALVSGLVFLLQRPIRQRAGNYAAEYLRSHVSVSEELSTLEQAAREMSAFGVSDPAAAQFRSVTHRQKLLRVRGDVLGSLPAPLFRTAGLLMIVGLIASATSSQNIEVAALGVVVLLLYRSLSYGQNVAGVHAKLVVLSPVMDQLEEEQLRYDARPRVDGTIEMTAASSLTVSDASYVYPGSDAAVLHGASLAVERGEIVGLVGPSGAGKSTLADLLVGLRHPSSGVVEVGGTPMADLADRSRAGLISLVPQAVSIVPGTVAENVDFFRLLDRDRIERAIDEVGLSSLIAELPQGIDTAIGRGSRTLSGGQAQRLGIARAVAGDPSFFVLDEPTSALDSGSEEIITDLIGRFRGSVGVIVIAHRLSTLRHCDRVVVVEGGRITGIDTLTNLRRTNAYVRSAFELGSLDRAHVDTTADERVDSAAHGLVDVNVAGHGLVDVDHATTSEGQV